MGEEYDPVVANEFVEVDGAGGRFGFEIGGNGAKAETLSGGILKSVQSMLIIGIIQRGHCITYGAGRCSDEAILTVFFSYSSLSVLLVGKWGKEGKQRA